jgi:hypothetical protein
LPAVKFVDVGQEAVGFIAVGQIATGVIAVGQSANGVVAIGQVARGVITVGQLSFGLAAVGQLAVGLLWAGGMLGVGWSGHGLLVPDLGWGEKDGPTIRALKLGLFAGITVVWYLAAIRPMLHGLFPDSAPAPVLR